MMSGLEKQKIGNKILDIHHLMHEARQSFAEVKDFPNDMLLIVENTLQRIDKNAEKSGAYELEYIQCNLSSLGVILACYDNFPIISESLSTSLKDLEALIFCEDNHAKKDNVDDEEKMTPVRFQYQQGAQISTLLGEIECALDEWKGNEFFEPVSHVLQKIERELDVSASAKSNSEDIVALRKSLAFIILKIDLTQDYIVYKNEVIELLQDLMHETFVPILQLKSSRLRLKKYRYDPVTDANTSVAETENIPLTEIDPLYDDALKEMVNHFDFYIAAFNLYYPDAFQNWAKNCNLSREIAIFSESLRLAI
ncbi:MAG TPA: hypothetical protein VHM20_05045, partial [Gammaproteobacteria bacterium]|nr:hypothetical protein [Gammaproteobacteria bacterium]